MTGSKDCTVMVWMFSAKSQAILGENNSNFKFFSNFDNTLLFVMKMLEVHCGINVYFPSQIVIVIKALPLQY